MTSERENRPRETDEREREIRKLVEELMRKYNNILRELAKY